MAKLFIEQQRVVGEVDNTGDTTDFLADNQSDVLTIEVDIRFENYRLAMNLFQTDPDTKPAIVLGPNEGEVNRVEDLTAIWVSDQSPRWEGFNIGDTIQVVGATGGNNTTATVLEIINDDRGTQTLITDHAFTREVIPLGGYVAVITKQTALEFKFGLNENSTSASFISLTDGSEQKAILDGVDNTNLVFQDMIQQGSKSWQFGKMEVKGNGIGQGNIDLVANVVQAFTIRLEIPISPFMLAFQFQDVKDGILPSWLFGASSLKFVFEVSTHAELNNPNDIVSITFGEFLGNVGWFDENLNGGPTNYSFENLVFKNGATVNTVIEATSDETTIEFSLKNLTDIPFSDTNTKVVFGFNYAPADEDLYRNIVASTSRTMEDNFMFDNVVMTTGLGVTIPRNGTIIKNGFVTFVSKSQVDVTITLNISADNLSRITANVDQQYMIYAAVKNHALTRAKSDKVTLKLDANDFFLNTSDPTMILLNHQFMEHPFSDIDTEAVDFVTPRIEDDLLCINNFSLDKNGRETDTIVINRVTESMIMRKTTGASFVVDRELTDVSSSLQVIDATFGGIPEITVDRSRGFKTPADDNRAKVKIFRRNSADAGGFFEYRSQFPMIIRWEFYVAFIAPLNTPAISTEFFDNTEPQDGFNQDWIRYNSTADWNLIYRSEIQATKNGIALTFIKETEVPTEDYLEGSQWGSETGTSFDENGNDVTPILIHYADGKVRFEFTYIGPAPTPTLPDINIVLKLYVFEKGTFKNSFWLSSAYPPHPSTWWLGILPSLNVTVTDQGAGVFRGEALVQGNLLPQENTFTATGRIYDKRAAVPAQDAKLKEDGTLKQKEGGNTFKYLE